jgi:transmembrane sensor
MTATLEQHQIPAYRQPEDFLLDESFCSYCAGTSPAAVQYWTRWRKENPQQEKLFDEAVLLYHFVAGTDIGYQQAAQLFSEALYAQPALPVVRKMTWSLARKVAAAVLLLAGSGTYYMTRHASVTNNITVAVMRYDTITATSKKVLRVSLPDHSQVVLNSSSMLLVPADYNHTSRKVILKGEAFFEVAPDAVRPFSVISGTVETRVLGTSFNIQAYSDAMKITVATGRVAVNSPQHQVHGVTLRANQQLILLPGENHPTMENVQAAQYSKWITGELYFHNQSLGDIAAVLTARYGIAFEFKDPACKKALYTASFEKEVSLKKILELLSYKRNIHFTQVGDTIWISKAG